MIFTILQWLWLGLIVVGLPLLVLRPILLKRAEKRALTDRTKSWLWFLQALGFWALVIGGWMKIEATIPLLMEELDEAEEAEADAEESKKARRGGDDDDEPKSARKRRRKSDD